jgi:hypothetical protein
LLILNRHHGPLVAETNEANAAMLEDTAQRHHAPVLDLNRVAAKESKAQAPLAQPQERDEESNGIDAVLVERLILSSRTPLSTSILCRRRS